jgi:cytochrome c oxidase subunit IV
MSDHADHGFNSTRVFLMLLVLTAVEVLLSFVQVRWTDHIMPKYLYWAALGAFAFWKGLLIYAYFMHMKFEGWIVKGLIAPTPILVCVVLFALSPDLVYNEKMVYDLGSMQDAETGQVEPMNDENYPKSHGGHDDHGGGHTDKQGSDH